MDEEKRRRATAGRKAEGNQKKAMKRRGAPRVSGSGAGPRGRGRGGGKRKGAAGQPWPWQNSMQLAGGGWWARVAAKMGMLFYI